jgi:hypothetical protein
VLKERYQKKLRWQLGNPERGDLTMRLWLEAIEEERAQWSTSLTATAWLS